MTVGDVILLDEAVKDIEAGRDFYEKREEGIGEYFVHSLLSDITSLRLFAGIHPVHCGYMRMLSKRFPFAVYYDIEGDLAQVVAILDMRQDPNATREILGRRKSQPSDAGNA